jgi:exodeoxyribonuclease V alpha subunit
MSESITMLRESLPALATVSEKAVLQREMEGWAERGWLRRLDVAFAGFLWQEVPDAEPLLILGALLASHQLGCGHACLDLDSTLDDPAFVLALPPEGVEPLSPGSSFRYPGDLLEGVSLEAWISALENHQLVSSGVGDTPLVLEGSRLYLRRCWRYEREIRAAIGRRLEKNLALQNSLSTNELRQLLDALFPVRSDNDNGADWQKLACASAARSALTIITGGPGTGKTTTVVKVLAALQALAVGQNQNNSDGDRHALRIRLAAPTGKAAARLSEAIAGAVSQLNLSALSQSEEVRLSIPTKVSTLHRLLGSRPGTRKFKYDAVNHLAVDVLVVDEASMVDLETMAALLAALPDAARLIFLGDKDQLASVEAGAVLSELCFRARNGHYTSATRDWLEQVTGERIDESLIDSEGTELDQAVVMLRHSHRFAADSGIGVLASAINGGDIREVAGFWRRDDLDVCKAVSKECDVGFESLILEGQISRSGDDQNATSHRARKGYRHYLNILREEAPGHQVDQAVLDRWAAAVIAAHGSFQLLATLRQGPWGVEGLNRRIAGVLFNEGLIAAKEGWYAGRPILITQNNYALGLMNGDIGITLELPATSDRAVSLRVAFPMADGSGRIKWVLPSRLQAVETVYALTIHKSQGSEFSHVAVVLPEKMSPIITRELLYTGVTRARSFLTILSPGGESILQQGISRQVRRASGLMG